MMKMTLLFKLVGMISLCGCFLSSAMAAKHALLIGIDEYPFKPLHGPVNDVDALRQVLSQFWEFNKNEIITLTNEQATKKNIIEAIQSIIHKVKIDEQVLIYFSGHGTSHADPDLVFPLPISSGAFIPYDAAGAQSLTELRETLIIGRRDLYPLFSQLDQRSSNVFVIIDACYSGNSVRGNQRTLPQRYLSLKTLLEKNQFASGNTSQRSIKAIYELNEQDSNVYPYKNIYYLSASGEFEAAQDISPAFLSQYPTFDGKPHGAFTDTLLQILSLQISADVNNDGTISYAELKQVTRGLMVQRGFLHTPQGLPSLAQDQRYIAGKRILASTPLLSKKDHHYRYASKNPSLSIDPQLKHLTPKFKNIKLLSINQEKNHFHLKKINSQVRLETAAGREVATLMRPSSARIVDLLAYHTWVYDLYHSAFNNSFFVDFDMYRSGRGGSVVKGETIGFSIRSEKQAYLLLINFDSQGSAQVIYPYDETELKPLPAHQLLAKPNFSEVYGSTGLEVLQIYAFTQFDPLLADLVNATFTHSSTLKRKFEQLINKNIEKSRASLLVQTLAQR